MNTKQLFRYLQEWYFDFLVECNFDMVDFKNSPARLELGSPEDHGTHTYVLVPQKDGKLVVWHEYCDHDGYTILKPKDKKTYKNVEDWIKKYFGQEVIDDLKSEKPRKANMRIRDFRRY